MKIEARLGSKIGVTIYGDIISTEIDVTGAIPQQGR